MGTNLDTLKKWEKKDIGKLSHSKVEIDKGIEYEKVQEWAKTDPKEKLRLKIEVNVESGNSSENSFFLEKLK